MNGIHDMGGMHGFGPVVPERDEPVFHADWERRTFALVLAVMGRRDLNVDEFRRTIERIPAARYLSASYYERWCEALETLLIEKGIVARTEINVVMAALHAGARPPRMSPQADALRHGGAKAAAGAPEDPVRAGMALRGDPSYRARFKAGDRVVARVMNPPGHTRTPRYVRGHEGVIHRDWGVFVFPDTHAHGRGANPEHCYAVEFAARDLWGADYPAADLVYVDLWESYLEPAAGRAEHQPPANGSRKHSAKAAASTRPAKPVRGRAAAKKTAKLAEVDRAAPIVKE